MRKAPRVSCRVPAVISLPGWRVMGTCANLSSSGLYFEGAALPVGERVVISVTFPGGIATFEGQIRNQRRIDGRDGSGIEFSLVPPPARDLISRFVNALTAMGQPAGPTR